MEEESRDAALLEMLATAASAAEVARAQSRLIALSPHYAQLSETARQMLATAHAVAPTLRGATGLDLSVAIIGLCKAVEVEAVHRIAEPLRLAATGQDMTVEMKDSDFARVAATARGEERAGTGSLAYFLRTAINSKKRAETSVLVSPPRCGKSMAVGRLALHERRIHERRRAVDARIPEPGSAHCAPR